MCLCGSFNTCIYEYQHISSFLGVIECGYFFFFFFCGVVFFFFLSLQLGSYFGAELCVVGVSELLAVGAPLYHAHGVGGEVRICPLNTTVRSIHTQYRYINTEVDQ